MEIIFSYTGQLASLAGASQETVSCNADSNLGDIVRELARSHGADFGDLVLDDSTGSFRRTLLLIADGEQLDGDRESYHPNGVKNIVLMTPIAGG